MAAFHVHRDAVVNLLIKSNITLQNNKTQDIHGPITSLCIHEDWSDDQRRSLSEISSRFVFHVGKVLL